MDYAKTINELERIIPEIHPGMRDESFDAEAHGSLLMEFAREYTLIHNPAFLEQNAITDVELSMVCYNNGLAMYRLGNWHDSMKIFLEGLHYYPLHYGIWYSIACILVTTASEYTSHFLLAEVILKRIVDAIDNGEEGHQVNESIRHESVQHLTMLKMFSEENAGF